MVHANGQDVRELYFYYYYRSREHIYAQHGSMDIGGRSILNVGGGPKMYDNQHTNFMPRPLINSSTGVYETRNATDNLWRSWKQVQADYDSHSCCVSAWWPPPGSIYSIPTAGAYEPPLAVKERVTCVPSKYKFNRGTGCGYPYMYMAIAYSNRRALSIFGKYCTWICISMAPRRTW